MNFELILFALIAIFVVGFAAYLFGRSQVKKAIEAGKKIGESEANDEDRDNAVKDGKDRIKKNEDIIDKSKEAIERARKIREEANNSINRNITDN